MNLSKVVRILNQYCRPHLAETWDNVGLLLEPSQPHLVTSILVTNDLTEAVLHEAIDNQASLILSYHPPIFTPLKRLTQMHWKERLVIKCLESRIAVYSPHTGLDAKADGINDWLLHPFEVHSKMPLIATSVNSTDRITLSTNRQLCKLLIDTGSQVIGTTPLSDGSGDGVVQVSCPPNGDLASVTKQANELGLKVLSTERLSKSVDLVEGYGRVACLQTPKTIREIITAYKVLFATDSLIVALGTGKTLDDLVHSLAVCAGSGGSVFSKSQLALSTDLLVTGEMSHHDRLDAVSRGITLILAGHSVSERGFLANQLVPQLHQLFHREADENQVVSVRMATRDAEPGLVM